MKKLIEALQMGLREVGIRAKVDFEPVSGTRLHRVRVVAPKFAALKPSERRSLVWRMAKGAITPEEQLLISMIATVTPKEMAETSV